MRQPVPVSGGARGRPGLDSPKSALKAGRDMKATPIEFPGSWRAAFGPKLGISLVIAQSSRLPGQFAQRIKVSAISKTRQAPPMAAISKIRWEETQHDQAVSPLLQASPVFAGHRRQKGASARPVPPRGRSHLWGDSSQTEEGLPMSVHFGDWWSSTSRSLGS